MGLNILIIGNCGVGKTFVMIHLLKKFNCIKQLQFEQIIYNTTDKTSLQINIIGKYDGSQFQGSDRLSMSVMTSIPGFIESNDAINIFEGDRFTNQKFIKIASPFILKIKGTGMQGREQRNSNQTSRQIQSISTRVYNISHHAEYDNSSDLIAILDDILGGENMQAVRQRLTQYIDKNKFYQPSLF